MEDCIFLTPKKSPSSLLSQRSLREILNQSKNLIPLCCSLRSPREISLYPPKNLRLLCFHSGLCVKSFLMFAPGKLRGCIDVRGLKIVDYSFYSLNHFGNIEVEKQAHFFVR